MLYQFNTWNGDNGSYLKAAVEDYIKNISYSAWLLERAIYLMIIIIVIVVVTTTTEA